MRFIICIHDATPAFDRETRVIIRDLAPLVGRRLSLGVVPDWHGEWPLSAHPGYCRLIDDSSDELLLHGCFHRRRRGFGPATLLTAGSDEMNGLDRAETQHALEGAQSMFSDVFGAPARGFIAPAWQRGHVQPGQLGLEHILGFFSLDDCTGRSVPLATSTWDCGRWGWPGYFGHGIGWLLRTVDRGVPVLAIHPLDLRRGWWPRILQLAAHLLQAGYEPATAAAILQARDAEVGV